MNGKICVKHQNRGKIKDVMASQVGVPPLKGMIYDLCHILRVNIDQNCFNICFLEAIRKYLIYVFPEQEENI